jgi:hypothetical protein
MRLFYVTAVSEVWSLRETPSLPWHNYLTNTATFDVMFRMEDAASRYDA